MVYLELIFLGVASYFDIKKGEISPWITFLIPFLIRSIYFIAGGRTYGVGYLLLAALTFLFFFIASMMSNFGGADVFACSMIAYYKGFSCMYVFLIAFLLSIVYLLYQKYGKKIDLKTFHYPFIPFLTIGYASVLAFF